MQPRGIPVASGASQTLSFYLQASHTSYLDDLEAARRPVVRYTRSSIPTATQHEALHPNGSLFSSSPFPYLKVLQVQEDFTYLFGQPHNAKECSTALEAYATCYLDVQRRAVSHIECTPEPEVDMTDPVAIFLSACVPRMSHLLDSFHKAGIKKGDDLRGFAHWPDSSIWNFLNNNGLGRNLFEATIIVNQLKVCRLRVHFLTLVYAIPRRCCTMNIRSCFS